MTDHPTRAERIKQERASRQTDPRHERWEFNIILNTLQDQDEPVTCQELLDAIITTHPCKDTDLFTYKQIYNCLGQLLTRGIVNYYTLTKKYSIKDEYKTNTVRIEYLPISNYCVALLSISVIGFIYAIFNQTELIKPLIICVITGAFYITAQLIGAEFKTDDLINKLKKGLK